MTQQKVFAKSSSLRAAMRLPREVAHAVFARERLPAKAVDWIRLLRVHQYAKNALILVPLLTSHRLDFHSVFHALTAATAFSLCASAVYIINDLVDLEADRKHPTKHSRPLASGAIRASECSYVVPLLLVAALALAMSVSLPLTATLVGYFALCTSYTFFLKKQMMLDVVTLALLYTIRVFAGAVAIDVTLSEWLLAFSLFVFFALALVKRYTELVARQDAPLPEMLQSRDYRSSDLTIVGALAAASALNAVTIFILYISSDAVRTLYAHPQLLWLICPILLYWLSRVLMLAHRRALPDDPVLFAITDRVSRLSFVAVLAVIIFAV
jgi:4-hydroxybenzoate polyprenyltransferase